MPMDPSEGDSGVAFAIGGGRAPVANVEQDGYRPAASRLRALAVNWNSGLQLPHVREIYNIFLLQTQVLHTRVLRTRGVRSRRIYLSIRLRQQDRTDGGRGRRRRRDASHARNHGRGYDGIGAA
jgi:hypothetical protein